MGKISSKQEFIKTFTNLGERIAGLTGQQIENLAQQAMNENPWFTKENVSFALESIVQMLDEQSLDEWINKYNPAEKEYKVGLIMAGNIPIVGFHDLLCVLASKNRALVKLSSKDRVLMGSLINWIREINPDMGNRIEFRENLKDMDAVIATGSDNSARYFEAYFGKYPNIIRKNRTSAAVITGSETRDDLKKLGDDIFTYFGLGCRNVSKLFVPADYDFTDFFEAIQSFSSITHHYKYNNNYDFNKSVFLVNKETHLDNGFIILKPSEELVSPIAVLYFQVYENGEELASYLAMNASKLQCIVYANPPADSGHIAFGQAQQPGLWDYADNVDTMKFLESDF